MADDRTRHGAGRSQSAERPIFRRRRIAGDAAHTATFDFRRERQTRDSLRRHGELCGRRPADRAFVAVRSLEDRRPHDSGRSRNLSAVLGEQQDGSGEPRASRDVRLGRPALSSAQSLRSPLDLDVSRVPAPGGGSREGVGVQAPFGQRLQQRGPFAVARAEFSWREPPGPPGRIAPRCWCCATWIWGFAAHVRQTRRRNGWESIQTRAARGPKRC